MQKTSRKFNILLLIVVTAILTVGGKIHINKNKEIHTSQTISTSTVDQVIKNEQAVGFVTSVYVKNGKNYIDIDYINLRHEDGDMPWGTIINDNTKIRTFELSKDVSINLRNKIVGGNMTTGEYSVSFGEFKEIFNSKNDFRVTNPWNIEVNNGVVVKITENFRS